MPIDPAIRRPAADAEVVATIQTIDGIFEFFAQCRSIDPVPRGQSHGAGDGRGLLAHAKTTPPAP
jgi:hypothetical protein